MEKYQVKYKIINTITNKIICDSILYSTLNPKNRILFNSENEAHSFMNGIKKMLKKGCKNLSDDYKIEYELYDSKLKLQENKMATFYF